jgi:hypothetical protein
MKSESLVWDLARCEATVENTLLLRAEKKDCKKAKNEDTTEKRDCCVGTVVVTDTTQ